MSIAAAVRDQTRALLLDLWRAAPELVRADVEALGVEFKAGLAPVGVTARLGPLLRERWPEGFDVARAHLPMWSWWASQGAACTAQG